MTGWMHFDNGRYDDARFHFGDALRTAQLPPTSTSKSWSWPA